MTDRERMLELHQILNKAARAYYADDEEIMSNLEYDRLYDELVQLEEKTGIIMAGSPTQTVGYTAVEELPKEAHERPMLSLSKTKEPLELQSFLLDKEGLLSWKLDGLTIVLTYESGQLVKAVTRGNGEVGEVITDNARTFINLPMRIPFQGKLILRGEAVITYSDFERINDTIGEESQKYKNPRNLCSGSVRQLNSEVTASRRVRLIAFTLVMCEGRNFITRREQMEFLSSQGFETVEYRVVNRENILETVQDFAQKIEHFDIPSDGLVLCFDDIAYGESLGRTSKFPRDSIAFKWKDEERETKLLDVEWSASRTGLINPVAIFEPVELEGTTVSRASVHNVSIVKELKLGIGDTLRVYKANMIIPQIAENLTCSDTLEIPHICPVCGGDTKIKSIKEGQFLYCTNPDCAAKKIKSFSLFVSRDALNIDGMSEATLEKFIAAGFLHKFRDLYHLEAHRDAIVSMEGFGEKSCDNLLQAVENSRQTTLAKLIYALGIAGIGLATAKLICRHFDNDYDRISHASVEELLEIDGVGEVLANAFSDYFRDESNCRDVEELLSELVLEQEEISVDAQRLKGLTVVITGDLNLYENRNQLKEAIEALGGKVTGSVSAKTSVLVNNNPASTSNKNKKAKELNIPIMTEEEFVHQFLQ
ncbi:MAG: NAD-dependent DNA ligase LigA [Lachnospiraceae bacterium]|nr:NAD-dependent DNA ligase LigA [Lachnospiraceae bacterium]